MANPLRLVLEAYGELSLGLVDFCNFVFFLI